MRASLPYFTEPGKAFLVEGLRVGI